MKNIAYLISVVVHPILIPLYALYIIFNSGTIFSLIPTSTQNVAYLFTLMGPILIPLACLPLLKYLRLIDTYTMREKHERIFPILITIACSFTAFYLIRELPFVNIIRQFYLIMVILLSGFMLITIRWKMSMHMTAIGALCGFVFILGTRYLGDVMFILSLLIFFSGLLGSCRLYLKRHTPAQVYAGFLYGMLFVVLILY